VSFDGRWGFVTSLLLAAACTSDVASPFPPGLEPLEDVTTAPPAGTASDPHPESLALEEGQDDDSNWVHATGYVHGSVKDVWDALAVADVLADRHHIDSYTASPGGESYDVSWVLHYTIKNVVTVQFDLTWREGAVSGTKDAPTAVSAVYAKTYGSSLVKLMKGSIEVKAIDASTSQLFFAQHMSATSTSADNIALWTRDLFANVVAHVHGQPLP
jgi:hypothetical protein